MLSAFGWDLYLWTADVQVERFPAPVASDGNFRNFSKTDVCFYLVVAKGTLGNRALGVDGSGSILWTGVWVERFPVSGAERRFYLLPIPR